MKKANKTNKNSKKRVNKTYIKLTRGVQRKKKRRNQNELVIRHQIKSNKLTVGLNKWFI